MENNQKYKLKTQKVHLLKNNTEGIVDRVEDGLCFVELDSGKIIKFKNFSEDIKEGMSVTIVNGELKGNPDKTNELKKIVSNLQAEVFKNVIKE